MRDLLITAIVFGLIPFILRRPFVGLLTWVWLSIMNPHRLAYGFAYNFPFAYVVAVATLVGMLFNVKTLYRLPMTGVTVLMIVFLLWIGVSPLFSFIPQEEFSRWLQVVKIQFMVLMAFFLVGNREQLLKLAWVLALSVGFYGIKGGIFTIATAGDYRVWGPAGSFIADNNALALAVIMAVPLFRYLQLQSQNRWVRRGCVAAMVLCIASAVGSQSRGAFLALLAMSVSMWIKGRNKTLIGVIVLVAIPLIFAVMPEQWSDRMSTIETYGSDSSAMGRINAWWMAWNLAVSRFPIGGGFTIYNSLVYQRFAPDPSTVLVAHSIYFQILGEHGFMGLAIYLGIFGLAWRTGSAVLRNTKDSIDLGWARDLASMLQVSLIGYAVGGAFLSLAYYDFPYYVVAMLVVLDRWVKSELARVAAGGRGAAQGANQPSTTRALS